MLHAKHSNIQALVLVCILEHKLFHTCDFASGWFGNRVKFNLMCVAVIINELLVTIVLRKHDTQRHSHAHTHS